MQVKVFQQGMLSTNCVVISHENSCVVVDCAYISKDIEYYVTHNNLKVVAILLTHGHFDHCGGVNHLLQSCNCQDVDIYCNDKDIDMCFQAAFNPWGIPSENCVVTKSLQEGRLQLGPFVFDVISTPGHTAGSCVLLIDNYMLAGDTLFCRSVGRTDFPESNVLDMNISLRKLASLDKDYTVIPGHGQITTLLEEKKFNNYLLQALR